MPELSYFAQLGQTGVLVGALLGLLLAVAKLPGLIDAVREVTPRRMRWLKRAHEVLPSGGEFGIDAVVTYELEREVAFRLSGLRLKPVEFRVLAALDREHPRDASWRIIREWSDDIEFRKGVPRLRTGRFGQLLAWAFLLSVWLLFLLASMLAIFAPFVAWYDKDIIGMFTTLGKAGLFGFVAVVCARFSQSPFRWRRLHHVFQQYAASVTPATEDRAV